MSRWRVRARAVTVALTMASAAVGVGCAASRETAAARGPASDAAEAAASARTWAAREAEAFRTLAAYDLRLAARMHLVLTPAEIEHAATMSMVDGVTTRLVGGEGAVDPMSFDARAHALDDAAVLLRKIDAPLPETDGGPVARPRLESELALRFIEMERFRADRERELPRSLGDVADALAATWTPPRTPAALADRDIWLATRLETIDKSLHPGLLTKTELAAFDDALDPLERLASPTEYTRAAAELVKIRVELGAFETTPSPRPEVGDAVSALRAYLGETARPPTDAVKTDEDTAARLAAVIDPRIPHDVHDARDLAARAAALVTAPPPCVVAPAGSLVRAFSPPPERARACAHLAALATATTDENRLAALMALHDDAVFGTVAARGVAALAGAKVYAALAPDVATRLARRAVVHPAEAFAAAAMADLVTRAGVDRAPELAARWLAFGDAPYDVVLREHVVP